MSFYRRLFLESPAFASAYPLLAEKLDKNSGMPTRVLGKTGARVAACEAIIRPAVGGPMDP